MLDYFEYSLAMLAGIMIFGAVTGVWIALGIGIYFGLQTLTGSDTASICTAGATTSVTWPVAIFGVAALIEHIMYRPRAKQ